MSLNLAPREEQVSSHPKLYEGIDEAKAQAQVDRVLTSEGFKTSVRMSRFLRYVAEAALDGRFEEIKETCIGVAAYDRDPTYDPKIDTVVRSEARRLRQKLRQYYETEGKDDSVIITLPKGGYVPVFEAAGGGEHNVKEDIVSPSFQVSSLEDVSATAIARVSDWKSPLDKRLRLIAVAMLVVVVVGVSIIVKMRRPQSVVASRVLPLTSLEGQVFQPAVSRDGIDTAFIWNQGKGNYSVYVLQAHGKPLRITAAPGYDDLHPSWSPDGRTLAFLRVGSDRADVMIVPVPGGSERKAFSLTSSRPWGDDQMGARSDAGPAWTADGKGLLVSDTPPTGHGLGIVSVNLDESISKTLSFPPGEDRDLSPTPSPDGRWIAFVRFTSYDSADIYLIPSVGGKERRLTSEHMDIQGLAWMPGSRQLLFSSNRTGMYALWTLDIDGGALTPVATGGEAAIQPSVSQNGKVIVYADASFPSRVIKASRNGSGVFEETAQVLSPNSQNNSAQFSPDGTRIVFASNRSGTWELWTALADGSNQAQLTEFDASLVGSPRWSPDGRSIVFAARQGAHAAISIVSAEGGKPKILSSKEFEDKRPGWSPDGRWVYFTSDRGGSMQLWKTSPAGGTAILVSAQPWFDVQPSKDGQIYFTSAKRGLWQMSAEGSAVTPVPGLEQTRFGRLWTVSEKGIFFIDTDSDHRDLRFYSFSTRTISSAGTLPTEPLVGYPSLSVSPLDGSVLYSGKEEARSNLILFIRGDSLSKE